MKCPKCAGIFQKVAFENIQVDRCSTCNGLWFDELELQDLLKKKGSEEIDIGQVRDFEKFNSIGDIWCPRDNSRLIKMVDARQTHIWFEKCAHCHGIFLDATEFTDLKEKSFLDLLRSIQASERKA